MNKDLTRDEMYIVQLSNKKLVMEEVCKDMGLNEREKSIMLAGYQQAIDFLIYLIGEAK